MCNFVNQRGVGVLVGEGEALALALLHDLARLPVVLVLLGDFG